MNVFFRNLLGFMEVMVLEDIELVLKISSRKGLFVYISRLIF